jgi:chromate reductase
MSHVNVLAFAGSLRKESYNRKLLLASQELAPEGMRIEIHDLADIPLYNMDLEAAFPAAVTEFKESIRAADGLLIACPEHNFSFSGVLKNALDWASRPPTDDLFKDKPVVLQSASTSWAGGIRAQYHLRQVLGYFPMRELRFPEVLVGSCKSKFDDQGRLTDEMARGQVEKQLAAFMDMLSRKRELAAIH